MGKTLKIDVVQNADTMKVSLQELDQVFFIELQVALISQFVCHFPL